jgi:signal transduction histidine kinase
MNRVASAQPCVLCVYGNTVRSVSRRTMLEAAGFAVVEACDGMAALALARQIPDLIIVDASCVYSGGFDLSRLLKADPLCAAIPILQTLASSATPAFKVECLASGADACLVQPTEDSELLAWAHALLRNRRCRQTANSEREALGEGYRRTAHELASVARRKDEFLAMLAHELRNPLNAIVAANALQDTRAAPDPESLRLREIVARQTRHLARLMDDLLDVSRITRGEIQMRKMTVDLGTTIERVSDSQRAALDARQQSVTIALPPDAVLVQGDDVRLEQVVANVLANAAKYSATGAEIHLELSVEEIDGRQQAVLACTDPGVGIPRDMLESVFDMFVQVDNSLARTLGGLGLGLTVVKHVVEQHAGTVHAESAGMGKGSRFVVRLPCVVEPRVMRPSVPPATVLESSGLDILLVEDNDDTRDLVATLLETQGHRVHCAADGLEGVNMALETKPDVALIDIGLPKMNGYDVARRVRDADAGGATYLVAVTGYGSPEDRARAVDAGFDAHIVKPIDSVHLFELLTQAGARRATADRTFRSGH